MTATLNGLLEHSALIPLLYAAASRGLLDALAEGPAKMEELAERLGLDRRATELTIDALVGYGLATRDGEGRARGSDALAALEASIPGGLALHARLAAHLPRFLETGRAAIDEVDDASKRAEFYAPRVASLAAMWSMEAAALAARLGPEISGARVLDAGCGAGAWGLSVLARWPSARLLGLDLPGVEPAFLEAAARMGARERVECVARDLFEDELPGGFDLVLLANVLRLEGPERAELLVSRLARAVRPGGRLVIVDALAEGDPSSDRLRALYAVNLALRSERGRVYRPEHVRAFLASAGLVDVEAIALPLGAGALGALVGRAP